MKKKGKSPKLTINLGLALSNAIQPLTSNQERVFRHLKTDMSLVLSGYPGTGKSFLALYLGFRKVFDPASPINKILLIRAPVASHDIGFLPGNEADKMRVFEAPYYDICRQLFGRGDAYDILKQKGVIAFESTAFLRGTTFDDAFVIVDEYQNCTFHQLDTIITRVGLNASIAFCGDCLQSDLRREQDKKGVSRFLDILRGMNRFDEIVFGEEDIVRSDFVKTYIIEKMKRAA